MLSSAVISDATEVVRTYEQIAGKIAAIGGVSSVGLSNSVTMDGVSNQDNFLKTSDGFFASVYPRQDAVEAVTVNLASNPATTGGSGAVTINFQTRSGTNRYTGSVYEYFRSPALATNGQVIGVTIAESARRGRIYTAAPSSIMRLLRVEQVQAQGAPAPRLTADNYGQESDDLRRKGSGTAEPKQEPEHSRGKIDVEQLVRCGDSLLVVHHRSLRIEAAFLGRQQVGQVGEEPPYRGHGQCSSRQTYQ